MDERVKFELYEREGVPYYLLVYPEAGRIKLYRLINGKYVAQSEPKVILKGQCVLDLSECITP